MEIQGEKIRSPLAGWVGGKYLLSRTIVPLIPEHQCYAEPFAGAAWVLFQKKPSKCEVINDINGEVVNLYRIVRYHWEAFVDSLRWVLSSREEFEKLLATPAGSLTDIQRAVRFYYLHKLTFGGRIKGRRTMGTSSIQPSKHDPARLRQEIEMAHCRLSKVTIENLPYGEFIKVYDRVGTFFYIDPPYWDCEGHYGSGIFFREDFARLADQLAGIRGRFLLSLNDVPEVRNIFSAFHISEVTTRYSCTAGPHPLAKEVLIQNY
ncbi:DNA adenine methylase [Candidatus Magnetaquicoccus inordinatus]|uniref:DNA adenine methylase n=1 Tax=Candidatus Magnetaquicoccus inordinatus TaxID=2496818 RepID=UPI00102AE22C|nr:DNA adenine methylase [Candidatus Magnetaquicoccus inordinatus]